MSNVEKDPSEVVCRSGSLPGPKCAQSDGAPVEIISSRDVPLGGPRAMTVRRTLPQRQRSLIGPWCFVDHYGPDDVAETCGMDVAPHPHTGLQTVSWLFEGAISHIDSGGHTGTVLPGEANFMTAGRGICHSEVSTEDTEVLHGVQLWLAMPDEHRKQPERLFEHYEPDPIPISGGEALVFFGQMAGAASPISQYWPALGAEIRIEPNTEIVLDVDPEFEHGVLVDLGDIAVEGVEVPTAAIGYTGIGLEKLRVKNRSDEPGRILLLGGKPFEEEIVMWWNFLGRNHDEIRQFREAWEAESEQFGEVVGYVGKGGPGQNESGLSRLPAPTLPNITIKARKNPPPHVQN